MTKFFKEYTKNILLRQFRESITKNYFKSIAILKQSNNQKSELLVPFLTVLEPNVYIDILIKVN